MRSNLTVTPLNSSCNSLSRRHGAEGEGRLFERARVRPYPCCGKLTVPFESLAAFNLFGPLSGQIYPPSTEERTQSPEFADGADGRRHELRFRVHKRHQVRVSLTPIQVKVYFLGRALTDGKRTAAIRASGICQGGLSPFWLNWRLSRTGDRLWLSFHRPRSPKLANGHRRETMSQRLAK